jgi:hypothetical protein
MVRKKKARGNRFRFNARMIEKRWNRNLVGILQAYDFFLRGGSRFRQDAVCAFVLLYTCAGSDGPLRLRERVAADTMGQRKKLTHFCKSNTVKLL